MKSLELPKMVYLKDYDVHVKPYIEADKIITIGETMLGANNFMEQELILAVNVIDECTDVDINELEKIDIDIILHSGLWDAVQEIVYNVDMVRDYVKHGENVEVAIANFLNNTVPAMVDKLDKNLSKYIRRLPKDGEWQELLDQLPKQLKEVLDIAKEDGNADIIRGAMKMGSK